MSRSRKKHPIVNDNGHGAKWAKTNANRRFRRRRAEDDMIAGKSCYHHKYTQSWNIHDYRVRWSRAEAEAAWEQEERILRRGFPIPAYQTPLHRLYRTRARFLIRWKKSMLGK